MSKSGIDRAVSVKSPKIDGRLDALAPIAFSLTEKDGYVTFKCRVQPGASKSSIAGLYGDSLKICLSAPPIDGRANEELIKFLSRTLDLPKSAVSIVSGETNRSKLIKCRILKSLFLSKVK